MHGLAVLSFCAALFGYISGQKLEMPEYLRGPAAILQHTCQQETGLSDEVIKKLHAGTMPKDREFQCHLHCLFDKVGMYDDKGSLDFDLIWHMVPDEFKPKLSLVIEKCKTVHGADPCETAFQTINCYTATDPDIDISEWFTKVLHR